MATPNFAEQARRMFALPATMFMPMQQNAHLFWENQNKLLDTMEEFTNGWFERRHAGTEEAQRAALRICQAENPAEAVREYQSWATAAFGRVMADGMAYHHCVMNSLGGLTQTAKAMEKETESKQPHIKTEPRKAA